jgi:chromosome segregation ATPase
VIFKEKAKLFVDGLAAIVSPLAVFSIGYLHHLYFISGAFSPTFVAVSLFSVILVRAYRMPGLYAAAIFQTLLISYMAFDSPELFLEQAVFSLSVVAALTAQALAEVEEASASLSVESTAVEIVPEKIVEDTKDKTWEELFEARKEITTLYQQQQELTLQKEILAKQKEELEVRLIVLAEEKSYLLQQQEQAEQDIQKLIADMVSMAEREAMKVPTAPIIETKAELKLPLDGRYDQLKKQFEEKSNILDSTRRQLFYAQEEIEKLKRTLEESNSPTAYEKALIMQLALTNQQLGDLQKAHQNELLGYEGVIQGLFEQLNAKA